MKKYRVVLTDYMYETIQPFYDVYGQYEDIEFVPMELTEKVDPELLQKAADLAIRNMPMPLWSILIRSTRM